MKKPIINESKILLVDNDPIVYFLIKEILEPEDYILDHISDGSEAVSFAIEHKTDLILLDIMMPVMDGFEVCENLQKDPRTSHIPVIFISAKNDEESYSKGFDLGAIDYLTKPINQLDLTLKIKNYLKLSKNEQKLKESELRYKSIVEDQTEFIIRILPNGHISYVNAAFCNFCKKEFEDIIGMYISDIFDQNPENDIMRQLSFLRPNTLVQTNTRKIKLPDGRTSWQQWIDRGIFTSSKKISEYQIVGRDVTIQKQYEEAIRVLTDATASVTGESFFNVLVSNLAKLLFVKFAIIGKLTDKQNTEIETLVASKGDKIIPNFTFSLSKENAEELADVGFLLVNKNSKEYNPNCKHITTPDGDLMNYAMIPLLNSEKTPIGVLGTISDEPFVLNHTTLDILKIFSIRAAGEYERMISERKLIESEKKFRNIFERSLDSMVILNKDLKILECNFAFLNFLNKEADSLYNHSFIKYIHTNDLENFNLWLKSITDSEKNKTAEIRLINSSNQSRNMEANNTFINYQDEKAYLFVLRDITERKEVQSKIFNTILETEDKERRRFAQDLHDGMGPLLSTIKLYTRSILTAKEEKNKEIAIEKSLETIDEAITQIKEISYNISPSILKDFGLVVAVKSYVNKFNDTRKININFQSDVDKRLPSNVEASLFRVIIELINNTVKHAHANNVLIDISLTENQLIIEYSDDGIGFELESVLKKSQGQGLFNIINRIKSINGEITFETDINQGFNVSICIELKN